MEWNPREKHKKLVSLARDLLQQERRTVRDVYYALESRGYDYTYRQVRRAVKKGCLAGIIDPWRVIDTSRRPGNTVNEGFESPGDFLEEAVLGIEERYFRNFWEGQEEYVEVWLEKADLSTVFAPICEEWNVRREQAGCESPLYFDISPYGRISYENGRSLEFKRIAMNTDQVERFDLPENPTPRTRTRTGR